MSNRATITYDDNRVIKTYQKKYECCWVQEMQFFESFSHSNIIKPIDADRERLSIILPNAGKPMSAMWKKMTNKQREVIIEQLSDVLFSLHKAGWLLRDLQTENTMVNGNCVTLIDFEHATKVPLVPFRESADLVRTKISSWTYWDTLQRWSLSKLTGVKSEAIVQRVAKRLVETSLKVSGPGVKVGQGQMNYQAIEVPELTIPGIRSITQRLKDLRITDLKNKSVLDVGCNIGAFGLYAHYLGASEYLGIEYHQCRADYGNELIAFIGAANNKIISGDLREAMPNKTYDRVFALAIDLYVDWRWLYNQLYKLTNEICYIESNRHKNVDKTKQEIEAVGFRATFVGKSDDTCGRVNFICEK